MGFKRVYKSLQEVFPQIDARALRAVAIEHSKDADAAVETVLTEIIPFFSERSSPSTPLSRNTNVGESSGVSIGSVSNSRSPDRASANGVGSKEVQPGNNTYGDQQLLHDADNGNCKPIYDTDDGIPNGKCNVIDRGVNTLQMEHSEGLQTNETFVYGKFSDGVIKVVSGTSQDPNLFYDAELSSISNRGNGLKKSYAGSVVGTTPFTVDDQKMNPFNNSVQIHINDLEELDASLSNNVGSQMEMESSTGLSEDLINSVQLQTVDSEELDASLSNNVGSQMGIESSTGRSEDLINDVQLQIVDSEELDASLSNNVGSQMGMESSTGRREDLDLNDSLSHASQTNIIEVLEQVIADARNNKTTLFSSMESVINLMRDVELKEQAAEQAKVEAAMGGNDILVKVEELKQMIHHATEANSMHAGEVYGEKSILASELRELQARVVSLSDERDKSLDVLDEMHNALELRLAEAEKEIKSAELQRVEKEKAALEALYAEELVMDKVVQESKILRQQAEENAKLQEFLVDRGRLVDMLQGEIAVICQDVRLLKEKFDNNIPFSKSLSSCHTSCILPSSSMSSMSSLNGSSPNEVELVSKSSLNEAEQVLNVAPDSPKTNLDVCFDEQPSKERMAENNHKEPLEDGWELFDGNETLV